MSLNLRFRETNLFSLVVMFVLMFGGLGLLARVLLKKPVAVTADDKVKKEK